MSPEVVMSHVWVFAGILASVFVLHIVYKLFISDKVKKIGGDGEKVGVTIDLVVGKVFVFAYLVVIVAFVLFEVWTGVIFSGPEAKPGKIDMGEAGKLEYTPSKNSPEVNTKSIETRSLELQEKGLESFDDFKNEILERADERDKIKPTKEVNMVDN